MDTNLYKSDFYLWVETTGQLLREGKFNMIDWENLIEEIDSMGRREKTALKSNLRVLLMHLLKYNYQPEKRSNSWKYTIFEHRKRITESLADSPSLKTYYQEVFAECYQDARQEASLETGLPLEVFPEESPFLLMSPSI
ncbi:DUF29 domain-containing protein [[Phormidium] sp. ETS-05]|uniref:DUF29 domain-containing protein n=1 Tax=[Phormidium] sp. ETS-05 TaxID=222819 RepID=UPI0018EF11AD|nr:DUF29 domain-containing protein [[Phormidium] sp. ETS-05]